MLNYQFLHTFLCVYRLGSQTKAAKVLFLTQPAVCQQLRLLESQVGRPLFTRVGKTIQPTAAAHQLALKMAPHLDGIETSWDGLKEDTVVPKGLVYVGGLAEFLSAVIAPRIDSLLAPGIDIRFTVGHDRLAEKLVQGELDLAQFTNHVVFPGIEIEPFPQEERLLVGHEKWLERLDLKALKKGDVRSLNALPWMAYDESLLYIKDYYRSVFDASFGATLRLTVRDLWSIKNAAIGGFGVTILPSYFCNDDLRHKRLTVLYEPKVRPTHRYYLGWKVGALRNPRIAATRKAIKEASALSAALW